LARAREECRAVDSGSKAVFASLLKYIKLIDNISIRRGGIPPAVE
jgi:hypothetical protein